MSVLKAAVLASGLAFAGGAAGSSVHPAFGALLTESGIAFNCGQDYRDVALQPNEVFSYERAVRTEDDLLEIRFAIRPLSRVTIDYEDPHSAAPEPDPTAHKRRLILEGDVPSPLDPPPGCAFHPRCPIAEKGLCDREVPALRAIEPSHEVACHLA